MENLRNAAISRVERPVKVLQFGEGNFLRAFVDWMIDVANKSGVTDMAVAIVKPRVGHSDVIDTLRRQDCLYHVCLEGIDEGRPKRESTLISSVCDAFTPADDQYQRYIISPQLRFVVSNTTEAGIRYEPDNPRADIPATFPAKVANLLWRRYRHFNGDISKGLIFLPCELIEDNGSKLKECVVRHAREAGLGNDFIDWVDAACIFADTLVDRIVSGRPDDAEAIQAELGFRDDAIVKGEFYHNWVIGGDLWEQIKAELPLDRAGLHVMFAPSVKAFRDRKVRVLNGAHTGMVALSLLMGCVTVEDAITHPLINRFVSEMMSNEILPAIDGDPDELAAFAHGIIERFYNPYIGHRLRSISLNSLSKWEARIYDTVKDNHRKLGRTARCGLMTFAALLALYAPGSGFAPEDNADHVRFIHEHWQADDIHATVKAIVSPESGIFLHDFESEVPGFTRTVASYLSAILRDGAAHSLEKFLENEELHKD